MLALCIVKARSPEKHQKLSLSGLGFRVWGLGFKVLYLSGSGTLSTPEDEKDSQVTPTV